MDNYKIGLLIFSNSKVEGPGVLELFQKMVKDEVFGVIKAVQIMDREASLIASLLDDYKNTNLGMIVLVAPQADSFFPFAELEEVGQKNEKYLATLNLDQNLEINFLKIIQKVKASKGKPRKGCDASCR